MADINTNLGGAGVNTGESWPTGAISQDGNEGVFGLAGQGNSYTDLLSPSGTPYSDSTVSTSGYVNYNTPVGVPVLYPAAADSGSLTTNPLNDLITPQTMNQSLTSFLSSVSTQNSNAATDASLYANVTVTDPQIIAYAEANGVTPGYVQSNVSMTQSLIFTQQVQNLPNDIATQLKFAYNTGTADDLSPELKTIYDGIMSNVSAGVQSDFGFTSDWEPISGESASYIQGVSIEYDNLVEDGLNDAVSNGTITQDQAETLRTAHYEPSTPVSPELKAILTGIQSQATQTLQTKYGFSSNWQPAPDTASYLLTCDGNFAMTYEDLCNNYIGDDVSADDQALLQAYFANPNDPSIPQRIKDMATQLTNTRAQLLQYFDNPDDPNIPDDVKTIGQSLVAKATASTIATYNLSSDWQPSITTLVAPGVDIVALNGAKNALNSMTEVLDAATERVNAMPDSPTKAIYINFLKQIGQAILDLQEAIGLMQVAKTDASKQAANAKMNSALDNFEIQKEAAEEIKKKEDKMGSAGWLSDMLNWIGNLTMIFVGLCMGPVAFVLAVLYVADKEQAAASGNDSLIQGMFNDISEACEDLGAQGGLLSSALNFCIAGALSVASCNVFLGVSLFTQDSGFVQDFVGACGGDETQQMICNLVFTIVVEITLVVVMTILTGGVGAGAAVGSIIARITEVMNVSVKVASRLLKAAAIALEVAMSSLQVAASGITLNNNILLAQIDMIKGRADSTAEEIDAMIQLLQKLINKLLEMLNGDASWFTSLSNFNGRKWADASSVLTNLMG